MAKKEIKDLDMYFKYEKTGIIGKKIDQNDVAKNVTLELEDGSFKSVGLSSFSRWWKKVDDFIPEQEKEEVKEEPAKEDPVIDNVPAVITEKPKKIKKDKKPIEKKEKVKKDDSKTGKIYESVSDILQFIIDTVSNMENCVVGDLASETAKFRPLKVNGKQFCKLMWTKKNVRLYFRCDVTSLDKTVVKVNYGLPYLYIVDSFDKGIKDIIRKMFTTSVKFELDMMKNKKKTKKAKEEK